MMNVWHGAGTDSRQPGSCALAFAGHCFLHDLATPLQQRSLAQCVQAGFTSPYRLGHAPVSIDGKLNAMGLTCSQQVAPSKSRGGSRCSRLGSRFLCCWRRAGCGLLGNWGRAGARCNGLLGLLGRGRSCTGRMQLPVVHMGIHPYPASHRSRFPLCSAPYFTCLLASLSMHSIAGFDTKSMLRAAGKYETGLLSMGSHGRQGGGAQSRRAWQGRGTPAAGFLTSVAGPGA